MTWSRNPRVLLLSLLLAVAPACASSDSVDGQQTTSSVTILSEPPPPTITGEVQLRRVQETWLPMDILSIHRTRDTLKTVVAGTISDPEREISFSKAREQVAEAQVGDVIVWKELVGPEEGAECFSKQPLRYLTGGAEVVVRDGSTGAIVGLGRLQDGLIADQTCTFLFEVELTGSAQFYEIQVGGDQPGGAGTLFRYTHDELVSQGFHVAFGR